MHGTHFFRRTMLCAGFLWAAGFGNGESKPVAAAVTIVANPAVEAHRAAIAGIRAAFNATPLDVRVVDLAAPAGERQGLERFAGPGTRVIIAVGTDAIQLVAAEKPDVPVISTMVLRGPGAGTQPGNPAATISLDVPLQAVLLHLKQVFPGKTRLAIIRNPKTAALAAGALQAQAEQQGFVARVVECSGIEQLLAELQKLKGQVDFVWCIPDGTLYNSTTIKPLILASIENRLPLIGFSEGFARAGAAIGIYPDFRDVGVQTGETAQQVMAGQTVRSAEGPRKVKIAVNQSVLRLLGLRYAPSAATTQDFVVLQ